MPARVLIDTNIFLRLTSPAHPHHVSASHAIRHLITEGHDLCYTLQIASEFWNACTRPAAVNGLGYTTEEAEGRLSYMEGIAKLLPETPEVYTIWRTLVLQYRVQGIQVHDTKLIAIMLAHSVPSILTFNIDDFSHYPSVRVLNPSSL